MKKRLAFGLTLVVLTALAVLARLWQRRTAFEPDTGLLTPGMPATKCVVAVALLAAAGFFLLGRWLARDAKPGSYLAAFSLPHPAVLVLFVLAGALLAAAGMRGILSQLTPLGQRSVGRLLLSIALLPTGVSAALVGFLNSRKEEGKGRFAWYLLLPGYCACGWLILAYQDRSTSPNVMGYVFILFGAVCAAVFCYRAASFSFEKPRTGSALWLGGMSVVLLAMAAVDLADEGDGTALLICLGYLLYVLGQTMCLVWRCEVPAALTAWTPPEIPEETEVEEHE